MCPQRAPRRKPLKMNTSPQRFKMSRKTREEEKGRRVKETQSVSFATRLAKTTLNVCFANLLGLKQQQRGNPLKDSEMMTMVQKRPSVRDSTQVT
jgi:hypothetical protein